MKSSLSTLAWAGALVLCFSSTAHADFFTSSAAFTAANPGLPTLTFEGIAPPGSITLPAPSFPGVTFTSSSGSGSSEVTILSSTYFGTPTDFLALNEFNSSLIMTFSPSVHAVGFNVVDGYYGGNVTLEVDNGASVLDTQTITTTSESDFTTYAGFSNLGAITSLVITPQAGGFVEIDNLSFGTAAASVPEPGSLALFLGLTGAGFLRRRCIR